LRKQRGKIVARKKTDVRLSLHGSGDGSPTVRLNLTLDVFGEKWFVDRDGARSKLCPHGSSTEIARLIQRWLIGEAKAVRQRRQMKIGVKARVQ
jgi:hypothetical protein